MDNLQGITYQTFEQDPVKYQKYEEVRDDLIPTTNSSIAQICSRQYTRLCLNGPCQIRCKNTFVQT